MALKSKIFTIWPFLKKGVPTPGLNHKTHEGKGHIFACALLFLSPWVCLTVNLSRQLEQE